MPLPPRATEWMNRAAVDYIGPFVKAWAAFNAWYRHASGEQRERAMLDYVKTRPNAARLNILPLLDGENATAEGLGLRQAIVDLHRSLDGVHFEVLGRDGNERISLRSVCIEPRVLQQEVRTRHGQEFKIEKVSGGGIEVSVTSAKSGQTRLRYTQQRYDPSEIYGLAEFGMKLTDSQRETLREFYGACNPRPMRDLVQGEGRPLRFGGMEFRCDVEELFAGLVETIYAMRNALFHGEVEADGNVLRCYEPAYRIVMGFLRSIG